MGVSPFDCPGPKTVLCILGKVLREVGDYSLYRNQRGGPFYPELCHLVVGVLSCDPSAATQILQIQILNTEGTVQVARSVNSDSYGHSRFTGSVPLQQEFGGLGTLHLE